MKITMKKCPACGRKAQYVQFDNGEAWFNSHKNRQGETCDEKPKDRQGFFSRLFGKPKAPQA